MSSTESSRASSRADAGRDPVYRGAEYVDAVGPAEAPLALDPAVHAEPGRPPRLYRVIFTLLRWLLPRLFRFSVEGLENVPRPPFIIASNHQGWYDTAFIIAAYPRDLMIYTMARRETVFNRRWKSWLLSRLGVFPISPARGELDAEGVAIVYQVLSRGGVVLIFPEGRYSRGRALRPLKTGVAHFALQAGVPISPVAISGLEKLRPFQRVTVHIGPPVLPDPPPRWDLNRRVALMVETIGAAILNAFGADARQRQRRRWRRWLARRRQPGA
jgi:1-acyl-sn-glycerol-3-phosphate acyltransferase